MVCNRCIMVVKSELEFFRLHAVSVQLGEIEIVEDLSKDEIKELNIKFLNLGFEIIDDKKSQFVEKVKNLIVELVHFRDNYLKTNLSDYIVAGIGHDYSYISNLFSKQEGNTIENYYILQKIERVKELLAYDELSLNEIALQLNYSSASHLSKQFKKVTNLTPTSFKNLKEQKRQSLEKL